MCVYKSLESFILPATASHFHPQVMASGNRDRHRMLSLKDEGTSDRTPGDTLPWNLSKYQKVRRSKSASAEVLDPAERAVIRIAGRLCVNVSLTFFLHDQVQLTRQNIITLAMKQDWI